MDNLNNVLLNITTGLPGLLLAVVCHEWAHAMMSYKFGDPTAKYAGRLTLNPQAHFDLIGTIIFPLVGVLLGGVMFGWAKPVPIDPRYYKNYKKGVFWVSFAGPLANIVLVIIFSFLLAFIQKKIGSVFSYYETILQMISMAIRINVVIAAFNLIPWPPLDGSKMLAMFMDHETARRYEGLSRYWFVMLIVIWYTDIIGYFVQPFFFFAQFIYNSFLMIL
ncbi:MAG: site-2 protease family protein [Halobacteriovoraceae bacterium]|nr:site-2 protease family protein [Halobacteriovoraceae bacterium]